MCAAWSIGSDPSRRADQQHRLSRLFLLAVFPAGEARYGGRVQGCLWRQGNGRVQGMWEAGRDRMQG